MPITVEPTKPLMCHNELMADPENLPKARLVAVFFGFPSFVFNELSWNPSQWFDVKIIFLEESSF